MDALLSLLTGPWTTYLLWILRQNGPLRFGELKRQLQGISSRVLTLRLRMLEEAGVIYRNHRPTIPPEVSYGLTERGEELGNVLDELEVIARRWGLVSETAPPDKVGSESRDSTPIRYLGKINGE
ncbi:MAG: helix-turn-helix transcriptional regulator [Proteobacteria bacterium]|nr:helix-turn-helix transcriptional regulator [Pseudomonadota bacterium]